MQKELSHDHHYLPQKYLQEFTNATGGFFIYDKKRESFLPEMAPKSFFFEYDLNTMQRTDGTKVDLLEDQYTDLENQCWPSFEVIWRSSWTDLIEPLDKCNLFLFMLYLHWRLPVNQIHIDSLSEEISSDQQILDFLNLKTNSMSEEHKKELFKSDNFKKCLRLVAPLIPFQKDPDWANKLQNWQFLYTQDNKSWYLTADNPIITSGEKDHDPSKCLDKFVFPVSGRILAVSTGRIDKKELSAEFTFAYNMALIERANRFIACPNSDFLKALIDHYNRFFAQGRQNANKQLFNILAQD